MLGDKEKSLLWYKFCLLQITTTWLTHLLVDIGQPSFIFRKRKVPLRKNFLSSSLLSIIKDFLLQVLGPVLRNVCALYIECIDCY